MVTFDAMSPLPSSVSTLVERLLNARIVSRIWSRDIGVWNAAAGSTDARSIESRLGWLDIGQTMPPELPHVTALAAGASEQPIAAVYLLGMGGSSLCAEVLRSVFGIAARHPDLTVLDTTDETTIGAAASRLNPQASLFLVSSKSGGTVEVASLERFFWRVIEPAEGSSTGKHFVAITDPGTALQSTAQSKSYRDTFLNPADIGGRFSALSLFGLVPAALIGIDAGDLLRSGATMAEGCRQENATNPGLVLGAFIGDAALAGRDKLTVLLPPSLMSLGLWIEQLIAESTGKHGKGSLPVVDEPLGRPDEYGTDRAFVAIATERDAPDARRLDALEHAGHPVLRLTTRVDALGAEFFRWMFATAVAGAALGINPFDEPNVAEAKAKTKALLETYASTGRVPEPAPVASTDRVAVYSPTFTGASPLAVVRAVLASLKPPDYVAFLSYLPQTAELVQTIGDIRAALRVKFRIATTFGTGPRYLHSTGQYHKGGPNTAVAFVITADDRTETSVPEAGYSFAVLKRAQALGDVEALAAHGRRVVRIHLRSVDDAASLKSLFAEALSERL
jgi:glucose-6-phosphate isomerase